MSDSRQIRCLVVDDHPVVRAGLIAILNAQKDLTVVAEAADGRMAIELFRRHQPDVALMDLRLPGIGGVEAIMIIRSEFPASRFVVLTTYEGDEDIYRALNAGAQGYLLKGMTGEELIEAVRLVARGLRRVPPEIEKLLAERVFTAELTPREMEVLELIVRGLSNREIAARLGVTEGTVKSFLNKIFSKLNVRDRTQAVTVALQRGIVHL